MLCIIQISSHSVDLIDIIKTEIEAGLKYIYKYAESNPQVEEFAYKKYKRIITYEKGKAVVQFYEADKLIKKCCINGQGYHYEYMEFNWLTSQYYCPICKPQHIIINI